jgi:hypothetical protein
MTKRNTEPKTRRHIWIADADWELLTSLYGETIGVSAAIQAILRVMLTKIREDAAQKGSIVTLPAELTLPPHHQ